MPDYSPAESGSEQDFNDRLKVKVYGYARSPASRSIENPLAPLITSRHTMFEPDHLATDFWRI